MSAWNFNISEAPLGRMESTEMFRKQPDGNIKVSTAETFAPDWIWAASKCGKVLKTHWLPETDKRKGRWNSFNEGEQPVAWQHFVVPVHPHFSVKGAERQTEDVAQ
jgi:hypothetical protein